MSDDPAEDPASGAGLSEEWIADIAESEGVSREEVVERLVASYWTLKEMHGLLSQTGEDVDPDAAAAPIDFETARREALGVDPDDLVERLERLEADGDERDTAVSRVRSQMKELATRVTSVETALAERQDELDARMDREFDNLETILEYLIETTDDLGEDVSSITEELRSERRRLDEQDRLADLKRLAGRLGVHRARCDYCDAEVEIALLPSPDCPRCDRRFVDIEPHTGWRWFGSNVLRVAPESLDDSRSDAIGERLRGPSDGEDRPTGSSGGDRDGGLSDRFVWGEHRD